MNTIFQTDSTLIYSVLYHLQDTADLCKMRLISKKWKETVDHLSCNMLNSLGARVDLEDATIKIIQITACYNRIIRPECTIDNVAKIRNILPKLIRISQIRFIEEAFLVEKKFDLALFENFMNGVVAELPNQEVMPTLKTVLLNLGKNIVLASKFNSLESFLHIYNHYKPSFENYQDSLYPACVIGNFTLIHTILDAVIDEKKVDPLKKMDTAETFLTAACKSNCYKGVRLLIVRGVDTEERNSMGEKPIAIAARVNEKMFDLFKDISKNIKEKHGPGNDKTLAHFAAEGNKPGVIRWLKCKEIDIDEQNALGRTPLMIAIRETHRDTFIELLSCGASLSKRCSEGRSPLDYAVLRQNEFYVEKLLERIKDTGILARGLKTAIGARNTGAINMISKALGVSTPVKYGLALTFGAIVGGFLVKRYFDTNE